MLITMASTSGSEARVGREMFPLSRISILMGVVLMGTWYPVSGDKASKAHYETPPTLEASKVLPPDEIRGDRFQVQEEVHNDGYMNYYKIDSDFGTFEAYGDPEVARRIQEIGALEKLETVSKTKVFLDAVIDSGTSQVQAIVEFAKKPTATLEGVPSGLKHTFHKLKREAKGAYDTGKDLGEQAADVVSTNGNESQSQEGSKATGSDSRSDQAQDLATQAVDDGETYAKKWVGLTDDERQWYQKLGVDPYTTNEVLRKKVSAISEVTAVTDFGMQFVPIPQIPGASELGRLNQMVWTEDPAEVRDQNIKRIRQAGVSDDLIDSFMNNTFFSPTMQTQLLDALVSMRGVQNLAVILEIASRAEASEVARFRVENAQLLSSFHQQIEPIDRLLKAKAVVAITDRNRMIVMASLDYSLLGEGFCRDDDRFDRRAGNTRSRFAGAVAAPTRLGPVQEGSRSSRLDRARNGRPRAISRCLVEDRRSQLGQTIEQEKETDP